MLGSIGNSVAVSVAVSIILWIVLSAKKLSDISWPIVVVMAAVFGWMVGTASAIITGTIPTSGNSQVCKNYEHRGRASGSRFEPALG